MMLWECDPAPVRVGPGDVSPTAPSLWRPVVGRNRPAIPGRCAFGPGSNHEAMAVTSVKNGSSLGGAG